MTEDVLPITVLIPETAAKPIEVFDQHAALRLAVIERPGVSLIPADDWDVPGVYILLDPATEEGDWGAYVGKAPAGIRSRIQHHLKAKDHWTRAILIRRDTTFGFNSAQIGWLEGRLYDLLDAAESAILHNAVRPSDETLPPYDRQMLESVVIPVSRVLRLLGNDPATADDSALVADLKKTSRFYGISVVQLIEAGLIEAGSGLISSNGAWPATGRVLEGGRVETGGVAYDTPSAAAASVKGGAANGWDFWGIETDTGLVKLSVLRARLHDRKDDSA